MFAAFSPDGRSIVSVGDDGACKLWDVASAKCLLTFDENEDWVNFAVFSPDGRSIVSAGDDGTLRLWDAASAKCLLNFEGHPTLDQLRHLLTRRALHRFGEC